MNFRDVFDDLVISFRLRTISI